MNPYLMLALYVVFVAGLTEGCVTAQNSVYDGRGLWATLRRPRLLIAMAVGVAAVVLLPLSGPKLAVGVILVLGGPVLTHYCIRKLQQRRDAKR